MRRWIVLSVAIVAVSGIVPIVLSNLPEEEPTPIRFPVAESTKANPGKVLIEEDRRHDFGKQSTFTKGEREWVVKNVGSGDLILRSGSSSCYCTVANFTQPDGTVNREASLTLKPGESTPIRVSWDTKDKPGKFSQRVTVLTSDPGQPEIEFTITGMIYPPIVTVPEDPIFDFGSVDNSEPALGRLALTSYDQPDLAITEVVASNPEALTTEIQPLTEDERKKVGFASGLRVDVTLKPSDALGEIAEQVTLKTNHPKMPELVVPIRGKRVGPISVAPERVRLTASSGRGGRMNLVLLVRDQESTHFEVTHKPEQVQVSIEPMEEPGAETARIRRYRLRVEVPPGTPAGATDPTQPEAIVLTTDHPKARTVSIPVTLVILSE
ncbi:MAG: hypothetical protein KatS3mg108_3362 [Isosphaeraceae bacterium]|jgi:hypothetical protein|nr:MAG: hypothetical protein KatS3mg108_3362 [Isosphaeraceae bacterium]